MRLAATCILVLLGSSARAEEPDAAARLVDLAHAGCDFFHAHSYDNPGPMWPDRKLAAHFGRVQRSRPFFETTDYSLAVDGFRGWKISYHSRIVTLSLPANVIVRMATLQKLLGMPKTPPLDYARSATSDTSASPSATPQSEWQFPSPAGRASCTIRAISDGPEDGDVATQRVLSFSFSG